jgi:hypothetical protein
MATIKQIYTNRLNAQKSTGPRTEQGKRRSRLNAIRHTLTAETVVGALEDAADYEAFEQTIAADYDPATAAERELVARLASVLWRLRRSTRIETGLLQIQAELMKGRQLGTRRNSRAPVWYDELDVAASQNAPGVEQASGEESPEQRPDSTEAFAYCFLQVSRLQFASFDTLTRYETALWRQAAQLLFMLRTESVVEGRITKRSHF